MRTIIHLSDLHVGAGDDRLLATDQLVAYIMGTWAPDDCIVVVSGDLTEGTLNPFWQRAHWQQMDAVRFALMPLVRAGYVLLIVPGNHDSGPRGALAVNRRHRLEFRERVLVPLMPWTVNPEAPVWDDGELCIVGLDSNAGQAGPDIDLARGCLGVSERLRCAQVLAHTRANRRVVVLHHSVEYDAWTNRLEDEKAFLAVLAMYPVTLCLQGHEHVERWRFDLPGVVTCFASWRSTDRRRGESRKRLGFRAFGGTLEGEHTL